MIGLFRTSLIAAASVSVACCTTPAEQPPTGDLHLTYELPQASGEQIPYRVYLPSVWKPGTKMPLVVILHGYGGTANSPFEDADGLLQKEAERQGFILAAPTGYNGMADYGANLPLPSTLSRGEKPLEMAAEEESALAEADVLNVIERVTRDYSVDTSRIYLMGNSMGMTGVLHLARLQPERWCAISASGGPPWQDYPVQQLKPITGMLLVHGGRDDIARASDTEALVNNAADAGIDATFKLIPQGTHGDGWVRYLTETFQYFADRKCMAQG